tara:strand:+ start:686 stop:916 length:231 start_codon:yes stop_codon:yes gene_type:complete
MNEDIGYRVFNSEKEEITLMMYSSHLQIIHVKGKMSIKIKIERYISQRDTLSGKSSWCRKVIGIVHPKGLLNLCFT